LYNERRIIEKNRIKDSWSNCGLRGKASRAVF
jgi:hypothetical protein